MRLDVWLDVSCLFKTRSEAQKAIKGGKVDVNRQSGKPQKELKLGDEIDITRPLGRRQRVVVRGFAEQHIPKADARKLYEDVTPAPSPRRSRDVTAGPPGAAARARRQCGGTRTRRAPAAPAYEARPWLPLTHARINGL